MWVLPTSVSACPWRWSYLGLPRRLIRGIRSGTGDQSQIARWVGGWWFCCFFVCVWSMSKKTCSCGSTQGSVSKSDSLAEEQCGEAWHSSVRPRTKTLSWSTSVRSSCSLPQFPAPHSCFSSSLPRSQQKTRMTTHFFWDGQIELIIILKHWHLE